MKPTEYLDTLKERLLLDPCVATFVIRRERVTAVSTYLRARLILSDDNWLEFSEYAQQDVSGCMQVVTYSYHWSTATGELIQRWDNTPHFPDLPGAPHHVHTRTPGEVCPGRAVDLAKVLDEIAKRLIPNAPE